MKRLLLATAASAVLASTAWAEPANIGIILGFTGPLESITPAMAASAELALKEASDSGKLPGGITLDPGPRRLAPASTPPPPPPPRRCWSTRQNVAAIVGADCSGVTTAIANNVAIPAGVVMVSPSATSPALTDHRGRRLLLPHRRRPTPVRARSSPTSSTRRASTTSRSPSPTTTTARASPMPSPAPSRRRAAPSPSAPPMRTARATIPPRSRLSRPPAPRR